VITNILENLLPHLQDSMTALQPRTPQLTSSPQWEPHILDEYHSDYIINTGQGKLLSYNVAKYTLTSIKITCHWNSTFHGSGGLDMRYSNHDRTYFIIRKLETHKKSNIQRFIKKKKKVWNQIVLHYSNSCIF
jgi:hypothetical protein